MITLTTAKQIDTEPHSPIAQYYLLPDKRGNDKLIMLNETETPKTAIDKRGDINTVTLIPNDSTRLNSNKLEPRSPKRPSIPD